MTPTRRWTAAIVAAGVTVVTCLMGAGQQPAPDYARDVVPILEANCLRCHSPAQQEGGLLLDTHDDLMRGGDTGPAIVPGNAAASRLIAMVEGREKPKMPPKTVLAPEDVTILRAWIDGGATFSAASPPSLDDKVPALAQEAALLPQVTALAFRPDGGELAVGGYKQVRRMSTEAGAPVGSYEGLRDLVRALAYAPDGTWLAAAGGTPGAFGEIAIFDTATGVRRHTLTGHRDYVYQVAVSQDGRKLASCGYDRTVRLWDVETGRLLAVLREHTDAVYAVAFSPDGQWVASGAGDRSVKIWDAGRGIRLHTLSDATDTITTLQFHPGGRVLTAAGHDKTLRTWVLEEAGPRQSRAVIAHTTSVLAVRYSPDGRLLASSGSDRRIKVWNAETGEELRMLEAQSDWPQVLDWSPDGRVLAVGRYDGSVSLYDVASGKRLMEPIRLTEPAPNAHVRRVGVGSGSSRTTHSGAAMGR